MMAGQQPNTPTQHRAYKWFSDYHKFELQMASNKPKKPLGSWSLAERQSFIESEDTIADTIFDLYQDENEKLNAGSFLQELAGMGIRARDDERLANFVENLEQLLQSLGKQNDSLDQLQLTRPEFKECVAENIVQINRILRRRVIIPDWSDFCANIEHIYEICRDVNEGKVSQYIPQLAKLDPKIWAVSICTVDGQRFSIGDAQKAVCMQSTSKCLNYALALRDLGANTVHDYVNQEHSGRMFNDVALDYDKKPHNPLNNAGAIVICSLLKSGEDLADRYDYIRNFYRKLAGGATVGFDNTVYVEEREAGDINYALGHIMRNERCFPNFAPPQPKRPPLSKQLSQMTLQGKGRIDLQEMHKIMDLYFQLCSAEITPEAGAVMSATLANGGICPITDENLVPPHCVRDVLSVMYSCGMYHYSGKFAFSVGLPAKSSVSGLIFVVIPNVMGICLWSPPLDKWGNSVRGMKFCEELVNRYNFHNFDNLRRNRSSKLDPRRIRAETRGQTILNLLFSAANGDITALRRYQLEGYDMGASDFDRRTPLHLAAAEGHLECVRFLIEKCKVSANPRDRYGRTPLDDAKHFKTDDVVQYLESIGKTA